MADKTQSNTDCGACRALGSFQSKMDLMLKDKLPQNPPPKSELKSVLATSSSSEEWEMKPPPDIGQLGRATWTLLHSMAAYYPNHPTKERKQETLQFLHNLSKLYPCSWCATDLQEVLAKSPPKLDNQKDFSHWMCECHNHVNAKLGKPQFDCSQVDKRWKREIED